MQQRQLRLGDILDDYCPRERRLTNHAVVAMVGDTVKQTRCTTCEAEHEYKHAKVPRQRRKGDEPAALYAQVLAGGPKRVAHEPTAAAVDESPAPPMDRSAAAVEPVGPDHRTDSLAAADFAAREANDDEDEPSDRDEEEPEGEKEEGPVHRQLIRATLPRHEGQAPPARPAPEFTIRQPAGRPNPFRSRSQHQRGGQAFQGNRSGGAQGGAPGRNNGPRHSGSRPPQGGGISSHLARRHDSNRKRSK